MLLAAIILSMALAPLLIRHNGIFAQRLAWLRYRSRLAQLEDAITQQAEDLHNHVIICGYGRIGHHLTQLLKAADQPYLALELNPERIALARAAGESIVYGDATRERLLHAAGVSRAAALVVTFDHIKAAEKTVHLTRALNPTLPIIVRTRSADNLEQLLTAGATEVLPEDLASSLSLGALLLSLIGVAEADIVARLKDMRGEHYSILQCLFRQEDRFPSWLKASINSRSS